MNTATARRGVTAALVGVVLILAAIVMPATRADAADKDKVLVCHNIAHNPVLIEVDDDSVKLQGHLGHADTLGDVIEGVNGATAADVRLACADEVEVTVPGPTVTKTVTLPPVTETVTLPATTETVTVPGSTSTVTSTGEASVVTRNVPGPTTTAVVTGKAVVVNKSVAGPTTVVTQTGEATVVVRDGKGALAYTGVDIGIGSAGLLMLGLGVLLIALSRRASAH